MTPEGNASNITGSVVAVCTNGTSTAARGSPTSIQCAPTVCIHVPRFETNCAIHSARNTGDRSGAHVETLCAGAGEVISPCSRCYPVKTMTLLSRAS
jgi:hypothetical protein